MITTLRTYLRSSAATLAIVFAVLGLSMTPVPTVGAVGIKDGATAAQGTDQTGTNACLFGTEEGCSGTGVFKTITNILLFIIGAISVIMLIIGGIRYTVSGGDSSAVTGAKNTILYAVVGIVVAILAFAVVNFVLGSFSGTTTT